MKDTRSPWNSLEVAKLIAAVLTPLTVVIIGFLIQSALAAQNQAWRAQERVAERRLQVYDQVREDLNRIYCYIEDVGTWKEETPLTVINRKRNVDQTMHSQRAIWSQETFAAYLEYMSSAFRGVSGRCWPRCVDSNHRI